MLKRLMHHYQDESEGCKLLQSDKVVAKVKSCSWGCRQGLSWTYPTPECTLRTSECRVSLLLRIFTSFLGVLIRAVRQGSHAHFCDYGATLQHYQLFCCLRHEMAPAAVFAPNQRDFKNEGGSRR